MVGGGGASPTPPQDPPLRAGCFKTNFIDETFEVAQNATSLERTESVKYLGFFIDEKLTVGIYTNHVSLQQAKLTNILSFAQLCP